MDNLMLSEYASSLDLIHKQRYIEKIKLICSIDPYLLPKAMFLLATADECRILPEIEYHDIYHYLVYTTSSYTGQSLKSYKSLEGYKYFVAGWIKELLVHKQTTTGLFIVLGKVVHSQRLTDTALKPWIVAKETGEIISGHCTCMAGLAESCSHVAAICFAMQTVSRIKRETSCTSKQCQWIMPGSSQNVEYLEVSSIDFRSPEMKRKQPHSHTIDKVQRTTEPAAGPTEQEYSDFYRALSNCGKKSVVLSVLEEHSDNFVPKCVLLKLPEPLTNMYSLDYLNSSYDDVMVKCTELFSSLKVTSDQAIKIEAETKQQAGSKLWFLQRAGRITASNFKAVTRTSPDKPAISLIRKICEPKAYSFKSSATSWGCEHEKSARDVYVKIQERSHNNLKVLDAGLFINAQMPHFGASPDALVSCSCCGEGILEIKCPYCHKDKTINDCTDDKQFCLNTLNGKTFLKNDHAYFYQVQCQLAVTERPFCDFVVWTQKEIFIERILPNKQFFDSAYSKATYFYQHCIMPELLCKYYSKIYSQTISVVSTSASVICFCKTVDDKKTIILCSSSDCNIVRFHKECLGLKNKPRKCWLCPNCRVLNKKKLVAAAAAVSED